MLDRAKCFVPDYRASRSRRPRSLMAIGTFLTLVPQPLTRRTCLHSGNDVQLAVEFRTVAQVRPGYHGVNSNIDVRIIERQGKIKHDRALDRYLPFDDEQRTCGSISLALCTCEHGPRSDLRCEST
jgi:hypothetical protein